MATSQGLPMPRPLRPSDTDPPPMNEAIVDAVGGDWLARLEARGRRHVYPARTVIIHEGAAGDALFIIRDGRGKVYSSSETGKEVVLGTFGPGDILGEPSLDGGPRSASVMTLERTTCVIVPAPVALQLIAEDPQLALQVIRNLIRLVRSSSDSVKSLALEDVYGRVVRLLMKSAEPAETGWIVPDRMTQQDIADRVGSSREMVSRIFKELERGGYLSVEDRRITIHRKPPAGW